MSVRIGIGWSGWFLALTIIFLHFMFCRVWGYPLTVAPFSLMLFLFVGYQVNPKRIWLWGAAILVVPFAALLWSVVKHEHPDMVHYFRTYALWSLAAFALLVSYKSDPVAAGSRSRGIENIVLICLIGLTVFSFAQVVLFAGFGAEALYNPFGQHQYLDQYDVSRFANDYIVRAPGLYLEPSFNAFVLLSLYVVCLLARYKLRFASALTLLGLFFIQSMIGVLAFIVIWLSILLHVCLGKHVPGRLGLTRTSIINLALACLIAYTGGFDGLAHHGGPSHHNAGSVWGVTGEERFEELSTPSKSGYYRMIAPLPVLRDVLSDAPLGKPLGQMERTVSSYHLLNGSQYGKTIDNGMYYLIFYFGWMGLAFLVFLWARTLKAMFSPCGTNKLIVLTYLFASLQFSGGILLPEYIMLLVMVLYQFRVNSSEGSEQPTGRIGSTIVLAQ